MSDQFSTDTLKLYLEEIARYPLLTQAQEVQLAKRIEAGDEIVADIEAIGTMRVHVRAAGDAAVAAAAVAASGKV